ncbi:hypothetical protein [Rathayibacter sp. VKM Ac-2926]|uniref:hypothetical protein n=1 Tax=Rathayibacter sp. VKM Ac-2926 TaxID=2929477 RepID=UPI001FB253C0|nr:hypothetical protein [Rathayibacter sp. VKM Ac-2926]MCJ1703918.1 hypothetical protein [Rathayibacter sp. VKM Ac-2926]
MSGNRSDDPGVTRRAALAMACAAPVLAAAVGAPRSAATTPRPAEAGPYVGLFLDSLSSGNFIVELRAARSGASGASVELVSDARMDVTTEHDVEHWSEWLVVDHPRSAHLVVPAGSYRSRGTYTDRDGRVMQVASLGPGRMYCALTQVPPGGFRVTATVTRGPVSPETKGEAPAFLGLPTRTIIVDV